MSILCLYPSQVRLPDRELRTILALQVTTQTDQEIDHVSSSIALFCHRQCPESLNQQVQAPLYALLISQAQQQSVEQCLQDQLSLAAANVVFGLGLQQGIAQQQHWTLCEDLVTNLLNQSIRHILQHHRLQGKDRSPLSPLNEAAATQGTERLQH